MSSSATVTVSPFHFFHRWTRWNDPISVVERVPAVTFSRAPVGHFVTVSAPMAADGCIEVNHEVQTRVCAICLAADLREVRSR